MRRFNGQSGGFDEPPVPASVDRDRECDFCGAVRTTHWLTFTPVPRGAGYTLPGYLGACDGCATRIDFSNADQLAKIGNQPEEVANWLAKHFLAITAGT
ncbi:MAG: hypothetical protein ABIR57_02490 [Aeromicrobium sp.]